MRGKIQIPNPKLQTWAERCARKLGFGFWDFRGEAAVARALLKNGSVLNPALIEGVKAKADCADFWLHLLNDEALQDWDELEKIVIGCEIIAALDAADLLAA